MSGDFPSGTVTFLFTDIEGSTRWWDRYPDLMEAALEIHDRFLRRCFEVHRGRVFATGGDGFCVAFSRARDAIAAAWEARSNVATLPWPAPVELTVRMAVHTGEATEREGDYFGPPVNLVARLMGLGRGGQVFVSAATALLVGAALPERAQLTDVGSRRLRGLEREEQVYVLCEIGSAVDVAPLAGRGNLPVPLTMFVGRSLDVKRLADQLPRRRLITLTGVGGVGKTRLALEAAWAAHDDFDGGEWFVELAPVVDPDAIGLAVAATLGVTPEPGIDVLETISQALSSRRALLILDNCEHVIDAAHALALRITAICSTVTVLATSREPLGVEGERVVGVRSLDPVLEAVELFVDRAQAHEPGFAPSPTEKGVIAEICLRLDGIPLAVELAAARTRTMPVTEILRRLGDRFRLLRSSTRGGVERHQTLRAAIAWSYQLLTSPERILFDRCSVFAGAFDEEAVVAVCSDDVVDREAVFDLLTSLVDRSMIVVDRGGIETRYRLLETLRQYAEEQLDDVEGFRDRHFHHFVERAVRYDRLMQGSDLPGGLAAFHAELDNLRAAAQWAALTRNPVGEDLVRSIHTFAQVAMVPEMGRWITQLLSALEPTTPYLYGPAAWMVAHFEADVDRMDSLAQTGLSLALNADDPATADCWAVIGGVAYMRGDTERGTAAMARSVPLYIAAGNPVHAAMILYGLADLQHPQSVSTTLAELERIVAGLDSELADIQLALTLALVDRKHGEFATALHRLRPLVDRLASIGARGHVLLSALFECGLCVIAKPTLDRQDREQLVEMLHVVDSTQYQLAIRVELFIAALALVRQSLFEPAAMILGHLQRLAFPAPPSEGLAEMLAQADVAIDAQPNSRAWRAAGATLSTEAILELAAEQLLAT